MLLWQTYYGKRIPPFYKIMHIHTLTHVPFEGLAYLGTWLQEQDPALHLTQTRFYAQDPLPDLSAIDAIIIMGGPMGVYDTAQYPWLVAEKAWIQAAIAAHKIVIGICLGAQLIAEALGAKVYRNPVKEIGWFPIQKTPEAAQSMLGQSLPPELLAFHWHGDTFAIPVGAQHLYQSTACQNQAFIYQEKVLAVQFHLEVTPDSVQALLDHCAHELTANPPITTIQTAAQMLDYPGRFQALNQQINAFLMPLFRLNLKT